METDLKAEVVRVLAATLVEKGTELASDLLSGRVPEPQPLNLKKLTVGGVVTAATLVAETKLPKITHGVTKLIRGFGLRSVVGATTDFVVDNVVDKIKSPKVKALDIKVRVK